MRAPRFWSRPTPSLLAQPLRPLGRVYGTIAARRMQRDGEAVEVPVVCVGNFTVGGSGKTPSALALAKLLAATGERPGGIVHELRRGENALAGGAVLPPRYYGTIDATQVGPKCIQLMTPVRTDMPAELLRDAVAALTVLASEDTQPESEDCTYFDLI